MIKCEKRLLEFAEKHIILIGILIITAAAFLFRRQVIWFRTEDFMAYFDMHENNANTALYDLCIRLLGYVSALPINGWKWLLSGADFVVACVCVSICRRELKDRDCDTEYERMRLLFLYGGCLMAPVLYIRGSVWAQPDALAFCFLLAGYLFLKRKKIPAAVLLAGVGAALYPPCFLVAAVYLAAARLSPFLCLAVAGSAVLVEGVCSFGVGIPLGESVIRLVRFLAYVPVTGEPYKNPGEWLWNMFLMEAYGLALISGIMVFRRKIPCLAAVLFHTAAAVCFSIALGWMTL